MVLQLLILAVAVAKAMAKGRRGSQAHGVGQTKHSQAKPSTQFGNRISCSTSAYSTWLDLRAGDCPPSPNIHPPPHLFCSHLCVSATTPATTTFAAPTHPCSCDRLYVCLSGNANGNILASTSLFATDSNITSFSLLFFFCCQLFVLNLIAMKMFTALLQKPTRQNAPPTVVGVTYWGSCTRIYEYLCVWVARDGVAD